MRSDMDKVLVERPRRGGGWERPPKNRNLEETPKSESMKFYLAGRRTKSLNENLSPLKKYLLSQVGRPWDKVYSEIRANISMDNTVQRHITQHLFQYVERNVRLSEDGKIFQCTALRYGHTIELRSGDMYVCPKTGILRQVRARRPVYEKPKTTWAKIDSKRTAVLKKLEDKAGREIGEVWFEATLALLPDKLVERIDPFTRQTIREYPFVRDAFSGNVERFRPPYQTYFGTQNGGSAESLKLYGNSLVYATKVRQMNSREIRKLGL